MSIEQATITMSIEQANQFLIAAVRDEALRQQFQDVHNPEEFAALAGTLGYEFTPDDLKEVVTEHSQGASQRRHTGIWEWLRTVPWIER